MRSKEQEAAMNAVYKERRKVMEKVLAVMDHVQKDGMNESQACLMEGIDQRKFRHFIRKEFELEPGAAVNSGPIAAGSYYDWEETFLNDLLGADFYVLPDFHEAYEEALSTLNDTDREIIRLRYEEGMTLDEIGACPDIHVSRERVRQHLVKSMRKMRKPSCSDLFRYGMGYQKKRLELQQAIQERDSRIQELEQERVRIMQETDNMVIEDVRIPKERSLQDMSVRELELSTRAYNALARAGITGVYELSRLPLSSLRRVRNLGQRSIREIGEALDARKIPHMDWNTVPEGVSAGMEDVLDRQEYMEPGDGERG